jgi:biotin transport system substrate-specific component
MNAVTAPLSVGSVLTAGSLPRQILYALGGAALIAAAAQIAVGWPIPTTMQVLAVLVVAALGGLRVGAGAVALYLAAGAAGLPVFAEGNGGASVFWMRPSGFFLIGFMVAALFIGWAFDKGAGKSWLRAALVLALGLVPIYLIGFAGMLRFIGFDFGSGAIPFATVSDVVSKGITPFIGIDLVKAVLALVIVQGVGFGLRDTLR